VPPSFDEMKDALDLRSKSGIHRLIPRSRAWLHPPPAESGARHRGDQAAESVAQGIGSGSRARGFTPSVIEGNLGRCAPRLRTMAAGRCRAGDGPHRGRYADRGDPEQDACDETCRPSS